MRAVPCITAQNVETYSRPSWTQLPAYHNAMNGSGPAPSHHRYRQSSVSSGDVNQHHHNHHQEHNDDFDIDRLFDEGNAEGAMNEGDEEIEEPEFYVPRPLKSRKIEKEQFGEATDDTQCFGCEYLDDYSKKTTIPQDDIDYLRKIARDCFGRIKLAILAKGMSDFYERRIRARINANLQQGEDPLPPWPPANVAQHLRSHHQDPVVKLIVLLEETEEIREDLLGRCFEESTKHPGKDRVNSKIINDYDKIVKLQLHIQSKDPTKMAFYSAGARVNPESLTQGILSTKTKKLHDYFK